MIKIELGLKTDAIENRFSFDWLFDLLVEEGVRFVQLGSFHELYVLDDEYFVELRKKAEEHGLRIKRVFIAHRELGGSFVGDPRWVRAARKGFDRLLEISALVGADYVGSNPGAVHRDRPPSAKALGLKALTMEPMSCLAEPPTTPEEMRWYIGAMTDYHRAHPEDTVPTYLCGDISHGLCVAHRQVVHSNKELFVAGLPMMCEFHF